MKNQNEVKLLVAQFIVSGNEIKVYKERKKRKVTQFKADRGRAFKCAANRRDNVAIRYNAHGYEGDRSFVAC